MTREFLKESVPGITDEQIAVILDKVGTQKAELQQSLDTTKQELTTVTTERDGLKSQIAERDKDIKALQKKAGNNDALTQQLADLQSKYDSDTQSLQQQLAAQTFAHNAEKVFADYQFSSDYARKAIYAEFEKQNFEIDENGELKGAKAWMDSIKEASPDAFKTAEPEPQPEPQPKSKPQPNPPTPYFVQRTNTEPKGLSLLEQMRLANSQKNN